MVVLESILSTLYTQIFCTKVLCAAFFYLHVTGEKLPKRLLYKKGEQKMLMKLTLGRLKLRVRVESASVVGIRYFQSVKS